MLRAEARTRLGALELDVRARGRRRRVPGAGRAVGRGQDERPARGRPGCCARSDGLVEAGGETWLDTGARRRPAARAAPLRLPVPGVRAVRAPERVAERGLPAAGLPRAERRAARARAARALRDGRAGRRRARARSRAASASAWRWPGPWRARPDVLLLDEPLSALDARTRASAARELGACCARPRCPALLVTHDFAEAALLGDRVGVIDAGRVVQEGTPSELAAAPALGLRGRLHRRGRAHRHRARRRRTGSRWSSSTAAGRSSSTDAGDGPVAVSVYPWEIAIEPAGAAAARLERRTGWRPRCCRSRPVGNRVRLGLAAPAAAGRRGHDRVRGGARPARRGARVTASWKAAATRLVGALEAAASAARRSARRRAPTGGSARRPAPRTGRPGSGKAASMRSGKSARDHVVLGPVQDQRGGGVGLEQPRRLGRLARAAGVLVVGDRGAEARRRPRTARSCSSTSSRANDPGAAQKREP